MTKIKLGVIGVGNCVSSLVQGLHYYKDRNASDSVGLMHWDIGGFGPSDIEVVAAFDIDARKVGKDLSEAVFALPNCTTVFCGDIPPQGVTVQMGAIIDGLATHMSDYADAETFVPSDQREPTKEEVIKTLRDTGVEILANYLPVGSEKATHFYVECALEAGCAFVNNIPVFIASDPEWAKKFEEKKILNAIKKIKPISKRPILPDRLDRSLLNVLLHTERGSCNNKSSSKLSDNVFETLPSLLIYLL